MEVSGDENEDEITLPNIPLKPQKTLLSYFNVDKTNPVPKSTKSGEKKLSSTACGGISSALFGQKKKRKSAKKIVDEGASDTANGDAEGGSDTENGDDADEIKTVENPVENGYHHTDKEEKSKEDTRADHVQENVKSSDEADSDFPIAAPTADSCSTADENSCSTADGDKTSPVKQKKSATVKNLTPRRSQKKKKKSSITSSPLVTNSPVRRLMPRKKGQAKLCFDSSDEEGKGDDEIEAVALLNGKVDAVPVDEKPALVAPSEERIKTEDDDSKKAHEKVEIKPPLVESVHSAESQESEYSQDDELTQPKPKLIGTVYPASSDEPSKYRTFITLSDDVVKLEDKENFSPAKPTERKSVDECLAIIQVKPVFLLGLIDCRS